MPKNIWVREKTTFTDVIEQVGRSGLGQGTSAGYEVTDGHYVSPPGNPTKGNDLEEDQPVDGETN